MDSVCHWPSKSMWKFSGKTFTCNWFKSVLKFDISKQFFYLSLYWLTFIMRHSVWTKTNAVSYTSKSFIKQRTCWWEKEIQIISFYRLGEISMNSFRLFPKHTTALLLHDIVFRITSATVIEAVCNQLLSQSQRKYSVNLRAKDLVSPWKSCVHIKQFQAFNQRRCRRQSYVLAKTILILNSNVVTHITCESDIWKVTNWRFFSILKQWKSKYIILSTAFGKVLVK